MTNARSHRKLPGAKVMHRWRRAVLYWYKQAGRRFPWRVHSASNYKRVISEVLLQRTRAETVAAFFPRFAQHYPSWKKLARASRKELELVLKPIGLYKRRARSVRKLATEMAGRRGRFPATREEIEDLPGVGQYIANAIELFTHSRCRPLLDVNMARVLERCFGPRHLADIRYDPYLQEVAQKVVRCQTPAKLNWAILDLAAAICVARKPRCEVCPVLSICCHAILCCRKLGQVKKS